MTAGEHQQVAVGLPQPRHDAVGAGGDLRDRLAAGAAGAEELPAGPVLTDLLRRAPLAVAVVPLDEVGIDAGGAAEAGQLARPPGPLQGTGEDLAEGQALEAFAEGAGVALAALGE